MTLELDGVILQHITEVSVRERARIVHHPVPGMSGDFLQTLGRPSVEVIFRGIFYGNNAEDDLKKLRNAYLQNKPVDFFTAAVGEGYFTQVLISKLDVYQRAGYLNQFDFICEVIESPELKQPAGNESQLKDVDEELKNEATTSINDVQNSSTKVSEIKDLWNSNPNFANPTTKLNSLLDDFSQIFGEGKNIIEKVQNIFLE